MKLSPDCIRDILMKLETMTDGHSVFFFPNSAEFSERTMLREKYSDDEIYYHLRQCSMEGFITDAEFGTNGSIHLKDLSPKAHAFLADIRSEKVWNSVMKIAGDVGSKSLNAIIQITSNVISELIKAQLRANGVIS